MTLSNFNATDKSLRRGLRARPGCASAKSRRTELHLEKNGCLFNRLRFLWEFGGCFERALVVCRRGVQAGEILGKMKLEPLPVATPPGQNLEGTVQLLDTETAMHGGCSGRHRRLPVATIMLKFHMLSCRFKSSPEGARAGGTAVAQETGRLSMSRKVTPSQAHQTPRDERRRI